MKRNYITECLERCAAATPGPWKPGVTYHHAQNAQFIASSRTDVEELAKRLKKACDAIRQNANQWFNEDAIQYSVYLNQLADELESLPAVEGVCD